MNNEANEFVMDFTQTPFGETLRQAALEAERSGIAKSWYPLLTGISEDCLRRVPVVPWSDRFGGLENIVKSQTDVWLDVVFAIDPRPGLGILIDTKAYEPGFDYLWFVIDMLLWKGAMELDSELDSEGSLEPRLAKMFGLVDPRDLTRPLYSKHLLRDIGLVPEPEPADKHDDARVVIEETQPAVYESSIPMATPQDSIAKAPERPAGEPKVKKSRAQSRKKAPPVVAAACDDVVDEEVPVQVLPEFLPADWKLSRRNTEVRLLHTELAAHSSLTLCPQIFHRLLVDDEKSGQIRWGDFEKVASY